MIKNRILVNGNTLALVRRRPFRMVNDEILNRNSSRLQPQAQLFLDRGRKASKRVVWIRRGDSGSLQRIILGMCQIDCEIE